MNLQYRFLADRTRRRLGSVIRSPVAQDLYYASVFKGATAALGLKLPPLYPVGAAAGYSLLYLLLRSFTELPIAKGLELGVGQSTILLDALKANIDSVDHDVEWVERIAGRVSHKVIHAPLRRALVRGYETSVFDLETCGYDFVLVDGPQGCKRRSRWGALDIIDRLGDEFLVIFDDAQRRGEQDTIRAVVESRPDAKIHLVFGATTQCLIFTPKFGAAAYF